MADKKLDLTEYGLWLQSTRLRWLETERPTVYDIIKPNGEKHMTVFLDTQLDKYIEDGYTIKEGDLDEFISELKESVKRLEGRRK